MISAVAAFFGVLALLVLAHEFGHFFVAKKNGVRVDEFGFGFPPRLFGFKKGGTFYSFNLLPFGGFVRIAGENESESSEPDNFASKSLSARALILFAGVLFNIILAFFIFSSALPMGLPVETDDPYWAGRTYGHEITVIEVLAGSPAEKAGFRVGDKILSLASAEDANIKPESITQIQEFTKIHAGQIADIEIERNGGKLVLEAGLDPGSEAHLGVAMASIGKIKAYWYAVPFVGLELTFLAVINMVDGLFFILKLLFSGHSVVGMVSGPVGIFSVVESSLDFGLPFLMSLVAILSVNLAVINLLPIPGLDGGRLLFLAIEKTRGRPISRKIGSLAQASGFAILIMLMAIITYLDIKLRL